MLQVLNFPGQERYAVPVFWAPGPAFVIETLPGCSSPTNPPRYGPITTPEFMKGWYRGEHSTLRSLTPAQVRAAVEDSPPYQAPRL